MSVSKADIEALAEGVAALREEWEFHSFWLGTRVRGPIDQQDAMALKSEVNRRVGLRVLELCPDLMPTLKHPDAQILLILETKQVEIKVTSLFVYGRYRKLSREIPQSKWHCRRCRGRGCQVCGDTGRRFAESVEENVSDVVRKYCGATGKSKLHSNGREDVDVRMLGNGRPCVIELIDPRKRTLDWPAIQEEVNTLHGEKMEMLELQAGDARLCKIVNQGSPDKSYRAEVTCLVPAAPGDVAALADAAPFEIAQETPRRVLHRRANLVRRRKIHEWRIENVREEGGKVVGFEVFLRVDAGTYIKELISGDEGRSHPSIACRLGVPCDCTELDVTDVHRDPLTEWEAQTM
jgi:tRNA pseudouridine synthase 10